LYECGTWYLTLILQRLIGRSVKLLLVLASTVILGLQSLWNPWPYFSFHDFYVFWNWAFSLTTGGFWLLLVTHLLLEVQSESESYVTTDGQPASLSWNKAHIWGLRPDFCYCQTVADLSMGGALSDERTGLSSTISAGPRQRNHSRIRVPWDSRPYFTVSDSSLPLSSPPTTRRVTVEVFGLAFISATKPNRLILFAETVAVCCENQTGHIHTCTLCGQNAEL
jgi:hypothetical protein